MWFLVLGFFKCKIGKYFLLLHKINPLSLGPCETITHILLAFEIFSALLPLFLRLFLGNLKTLWGQILPEMDGGALPSALGKSSWTYLLVSRG